ncbi:hypothetical protein SAMD00024442_31_1 [Candidatus Symbiothrix dinenymphae]|nr:hypothetical protein SAMD00024442_31_1 [Candidatus Symbiothrix dinenymphae]
MTLGKKFCILFLLFIGVAPALAQDRTISGVVVGENKKPLRDVVVAVKEDFSIRDTTDEYGSFMLTVPASARRLILTHPDMITAEVAIVSQVRAYTRKPPLRYEISIHAGGSVVSSSLDYTPNVGSRNKFVIGLYDVGVGYTYFFTKQLGVSTGASVAHFNSKYTATIEESYPVTPGTFDGTSGLYEPGFSITDYNYTAHDYTETQQLILLTIPVLLHFETNVITNGKFYAKGGVKFGFPFPSGFPLSSDPTYKGNIDKLVASGKLTDGNTIEAPKYMGFGTFSNLGNEGIIKGDSIRVEQGTTIFASLEMGIKWEFSNKWSLYTGAYIDIDCGLNKMNVEIDNAKRNFIEPKANYLGNINADYRPTGMLFAKTTEGKPVVDKVVLSPFSAGLRLTLAFGKRVKKPAYTQYIPPPPPIDIVEPELPIDTLPIVQEKRKKSVADPKRIEKTVDMKRLQQPIYFEFNRSDLLDDSKKALDANIIALKRVLEEKIRILKKYPDWEITLEGHCDNVGTPEYNKVLGQERAETVKAYLLTSS